MPFALSLSKPVLSQPKGVNGKCRMCQAIRPFMVRQACPELFALRQAQCERSKGSPRTDLIRASLSNPENLLGISVTFIASIQDKWRNDIAPGTPVRHAKWHIYCSLFRHIDKQDALTAPNATEP